MKFTYASGSKPLEGFTIKRGVGAGGFGEVFYALTDSGKEVALKHIQRNLDIEMRGVKHCLNLKHPHLVALFDIKFDDAGEGWVVMEYVRGENLKEILDRRPSGLPPEEAIRWFRPIAAAVGYLHDHGIVHRDLKPGNIFNDAGTIKIGDYGLSKFISVSRRSGQTESVGTFHYMAPEIGKGVYGKEIDIYALGIMLHEILTGHVPFEGESSQEIIMKHLTAEPDLRGVPEPFRSTIAKALAKDPAKRTGTVEEMLANLGLSKNETVVESLHDDVKIERPRQSAPQAEDPIVPPLNSAEPDEPVARAISGGMRSLNDWWNNDNISLLPKILVLVLCSVALIANLGWLIPLGLLAGAAYMVYLLGRTIYLHMNDTPAKSSATQYSTYHPVVMTRKERAQERRTQKISRRERERNALAAIPLDLRMKSLVGSFLVSAVSAAVISLLALILGGVSLEAAPATWAPLFGWLTVMTICGSWSVLLVGKLWERNEGDPWLRRFAMVGVGLTLGLIGFAAGNALLLEMPAPGQGAVTGWHENLDLRDWFETLKRGPSLTTFAIVFGAQFGLLRWWRQADPLRKTRLSLWTLAVTVMTAALINYFTPFIQPWGLILVGAISLVVQISAPWYSPQQREALRHQQQALAETSASA